MDKLIGGAQGILVGSPLRGDDFVDRLHYFITAAILLVLAAYITYQESKGKPIDCFPPPQFKEEGAKDTVNTYCFARTLTLPEAHHVKDNATFVDYGAEEQQALIMDFGTTFYKWAPLILVIMAFSFKAPKMLWTKVSGRPGQDLRKIRDLVLEARSFKKVKQKQRKMHQVSRYFETFATDYKKYNLPIIGENNGKFLAVFFCLGRNSGSYLSSLYLAIKVLNFFNLIFNFGLLSSFLTKSYWRYGYDGIKSIFTTGDWEDPYNFPRVLYCDFEMPETATSGDSTASASPGSVPSVYEVKCMMSINLILEKIFLVFWFWLIILFWVTLANLFFWFLKIKEPCSHIFFIRDYMKIVYQSYEPKKNDDASSSSSSSDDSSVFISDEDRDMIERFVEDYIRSDGVFLLRLLELNADRSIAADVIICLWNRYRKLQMRRGLKGNNIEQIEQLILENEGKNSHMEKFLEDTQKSRRKSRSNTSLTRHNRKPSTTLGIKAAKSVPLLGATPKMEDQGLSTITGIASPGDHAMAAMNMQDIVNNNPGGVNIPMQDFADLGGGVGDKLGGLGGELGDKLGGLGGELGDKLGGLGGELGDKLGGLGGGLGDKLGGLGDNFGGIAGGFGDKLEGLGGGLGDKLGGFGDKLDDLGGGLGGAFGDKLGGLGGDLGDKLGDVGGGLGDKFGGFMDNVGGGAGGFQIPGASGGGNLPGGMDLPGGFNFGGGGGDKEGGGGGMGGLFNQRF